MFEIAAANRLRNDIDIIAMTTYKDDLLIEVSNARIVLSNGQRPQDIGKITKYSKFYINFTKLFYKIIFKRLTGFSI